MLKQRIVSVLVLLPPVAVAAYFGHPWLTLLVMLAVGLGAYEFAKVEHIPGHNTSRALAAGGAVLFALERGFLSGHYQTTLLVLFIIVVTIYFVLHARTKTPTESWALTIVAAVYVGFLGSYIIALRNLPQGLAWLALAVVNMWVGDSGAYFVGSGIGKHKMAPHLSPKKTWEGIAGGLISALIFGVLIAYLGGLSVVDGLVSGLLVGVICPFGDLAISMVKREVGVKDTSNLIPGHGGALDRLDTLLFICPLMFYYATLLS